MRRWIVAAALLAAGCANPMKDREPPPKPFVGTVWQVQLELPMAGEQPHIRLGDGRLEGFGGCNRFNARYLQDSVGARAIAIGAINASKRMCDGSTMNAENRVIEVLQSVSSYTITADIMLMSGSGGTLKLKALPDEKDKDKEKDKK
jgi:heat shock protein HslJ